MERIGNVRNLHIGQQGENDAVTIEIDISQWYNRDNRIAVGAVAFRPSAESGLVNKDDFYIPDISMTVEEPDEDEAPPLNPAGVDEGDDFNVGKKATLTWTVHYYDTQYAGRGAIEFRAFVYETDGQGNMTNTRVLMARTVQTFISSTLSGYVVNAPETPDWVTEVLEVGELLKEANDLIDEIETATQEALAAIAQAQEDAEDAIASLCVHPAGDTEQTPDIGA